MPAIPQFTPQEGLAAARSVEVRPTELGIQAEESAARNVGRLSAQEGESIRRGYEAIGRGLGAAATGLDTLGKIAEYHTETQELSSLGTVAANVKANLYGQLNDAVKAGTPDAMSKFQDGLEQQLDQFSGLANTPGGQRHAVEQANQLREQFKVAAVAMLGHQAAQQGVVNLNNAVNQYTNLSTQHPETLDGNINLLSQHIDTLVAQHEINPENAGKLSELKQRQIGSLVKATIASVALGNDQTGVIPNPSAANAMIGRYAQYLTPQEQQEAAASIRGAQGLIDTREKQAFEVQKQINAEAFRDQMNTLVGQTIQSGKPFDPMELVKLTTMPGANTEQILSLQKYNTNLATNPKGAHDDATYNDFVSRMFAPQGDPLQLTENEVFAARAGNKLTQPEFTFFREKIAANDKGQHETENKIATAFQSGVKQQLNPTNGLGGFMNPNGAMNYARWLGDAEPMVRTLMLGNMSATQAWQQVSTPEFLAKYRQTGATNLEGMQGLALPPAAAPKSPQESKGILDRIFSGFGSK